MRFKPSQSAGFTLLEILLVVVILVILTAASIQLVGGRSYEDKIKEQSQDLIKQINYMCEKAVFENRPFALEFIKESHQLLTYRKQKWLAINDKQWPFKEIDPEINRQLYVSGKVQNLSADFVQKPHVICYNTGQLTAFELLLNSGSAENLKVTYQIKSTQPTKVSSGWLNES